MKISNEAKVGLLVAATIAVALGFGWIVGLPSPWSQSVRFYVTYNFAGGIDVGSPVRVSGIKAGKVEKIEFFTPGAPTAIALKEPGSPTDNPDEQMIVPLKVRISVQKDAALGVRKDSRFYINLAGIIGERYVEITPGSRRSDAIKDGDVVMGIDPPRIDQLLSQSFNLAGKIMEVIEENKGDLSKSIELIYKLSGNINKTLAFVDKSALFKTDLSQLVNNLIQITSDVRKVTDKMHTAEGDKTLKLLHDLLWRLEPVDSKAVRDFFQKEGMKVKLF